MGASTRDDAQGIDVPSEAARLVDRNVKAVYGDLEVLTVAGVIDQSEKGVAYPFDAIHVDFQPTAAA